MRTLIVAALLLATIPVSDWLVSKFPPPAIDEPMEYSEADHKAMAALIDRVTPAAPVVMMKDGFMIYDSQSRAETLAKLWNVKSVAEAKKLLKMLDKKRYRESGL